MKIAVIDFGAGNLHSICNSLRFLGHDYVVTDDKSVISSCDKIIFPGVGAFNDAVNMLHRKDLFGFIQEQARNKFFLGICLGMQLLFEKGYEFGITEGLGLIKGEVKPIVPKDGLKIPHMGWNALKLTGRDVILEGFENEYVYFVHSFCAYTSPENVSAYTEYGYDLTASVIKDNIRGFQFHPEKSGRIGLKLLNNFCEL